MNGSGQQRTGRRRAALTATLVAVPVALVSGFGAFWLFGGLDSKPQTGPVRVSPPPALAAAEEHCPRLIGMLPRRLADSSLRDAVGAPGRAAAWGDPPIVLRCGVPRSAADTKSAQLLIIEGVSWVYESGGDATVWTTTSLTVPVEVRVPAKYRDQASTKILNPLAKPLAATVPQLR